MATTIEVQGMGQPADKAGERLMHAIYDLNAALHDHHGFFVTVVLEDGRRYRGVLGQPEEGFQVKSYAEGKLDIVPEGEELPAQIDPSDVNLIKITYD